MKVQDYIDSVKISNADRKKRMLALGEQRFNSLLERNGGHHSVLEVATRLGLSERKIQHQALNRQLLAFKEKRKWRFPTGQFEGSRKINELEKVLAVFAKSTDNVSMVIFFLSEYEGTGCTSLQLLKEGLAISNIVGSIQSLFDHGAR